jgi:hypothetical protein
MFAPFGGKVWEIHRTDGENRRLIRRDAFRRVIEDKIVPRKDFLDMLKAAVAK